MNQDASSSVFYVPTGKQGTHSPLWNPCHYTQQYARNIRLDIAGRCIMNWLHVLHFEKVLKLQKKPPCQKWFGSAFLIQKQCLIITKYSGFMLQNVDMKYAIMMLTWQMLTAETLLTLSCRTTYICCTAPLTSRCCILYIIQQIYVQNILNMLHNLHFFLFKMPFIS